MLHRLCGVASSGCGHHLNSLTDKQRLRVATRGRMYSNDFDQAHLGNSNPRPMPPATSTQSPLAPAFQPAPQQLPSSSPQDPQDFHPTGVVHDAADMGQDVAGLIGETVGKGTEAVRKTVDKGTKVVGGTAKEGAQAVGGLVEATAHKIGQVAGAVTSNLPEVVELPVPRMLKRVQLRMGSHNQFKVSYLPPILYDPVPPSAGQAGMMMIVDPTLEPGRFHLRVDPATLLVPDIDHVTATILFGGKHIRMPGIMRMRMNIIDVKGYTELSTGQVDMQMHAEILVVTPVLHLPPLSIIADLTTEEVEGVKFRAKGQRLKNGITRTVAVTLVPKSKSRLLNTVLRLPAEAVLEMEVFMELFGHTTQEAHETQSLHPHPVAKITD